MKIYDVTNNNDRIHVVERDDYAVVDLDNNDWPIHYEHVPKAFAESIRKMKSGETVSIEKEPDASRLFRGWRGEVQKWEEVVEPVAEGEDLTMSVIGATQVTQATTIFTQILHVFTIFLI